MIWGGGGVVVVVVKKNYEIDKKKILFYQKFKIKWINNNNMK